MICIDCMAINKDIVQWLPSHAVMAQAAVTDGETTAMTTAMTAAAAAAAAKTAQTVETAETAKTARRRRRLWRRGRWRQHGGSY